MYTHLFGRYHPPLHPANSRFVQFRRILAWFLGGKTRRTKRCNSRQAFGPRFLVLDSGGKAGRDASMSSHNRAGISRMPFSGSGRWPISPP
jgi:hypothetical protein